MAMHSRFLTGVDPFPSAYLVVDIFFMMSGFVIAHAYDARLRGGRYFRAFVWRRYSRLLPMWSVGLTLGTVFTVVFDHRDPHLGWNIALYLTGLFFFPLQLVLPREPEAYLFPRNSPGWSLFFEMVANLGYGITAARLGPRLLGAIALASGVGVAAVGWIHGDLDAGAVRATAAIGALRTVFGFSVGLLLYRFRSGLGGSLPAGLFATVMLVLIALARIDPPPGLRRMFDPAIVLFVCPAVVWVGIRARTGAPRLAETLGAISYPLYAVHFAVILPALFVWGHLTHWRADKMSGPAAALICAGVLVLAYLLGRYVDPAAQRFAARLLHRHPVQTPSPALAER